MRVGQTLINHKPFGGFYVLEHPYEGYLFNPYIADSSDQRYTREGFLVSGGVGVRT